MSHLLAYWCIYWDEMKSLDYRTDRWKALKDEKEWIKKNGWGAAEERIQDQIDIGENLWVVGRGNPVSKPNNWCLLLRLNVQRYGTDPGNDHYCRVFSDDFHFFDPERQPDLEPLLKDLQFESGKRIPSDVTGGMIGCRIQNRRPITLYDNNLLLEWVNTNRISVI